MRDVLDDVCRVYVVGVYMVGEHVIAAEMYTLYIHMMIMQHISHVYISHMSHTTIGVLRVLHNTHEVDVVHAPCIVGQAALLEWIAKEKQTRPATLRALTNCYLWKLSMHELVVYDVDVCLSVCNMKDVDVCG